MAFDEASGRITALEMSLAEVEENYQQVSNSLGAANLKLEEVGENLTRNQQVLEEVLFYCICYTYRTYCRNNYLMGLNFNVLHRETGSWKIAFASATLWSKLSTIENWSFLALERNWLK